MSIVEPSTQLTFSRYNILMVPLSADTAKEISTELAQEQTATDLISLITDGVTSGKIPDNDLKSLLNLTKSLTLSIESRLKPKSKELSIGIELAKTIKERGVVMLHGRLNKAWFSDSLPLNGLEEEQVNFHNVTSINCPTTPEAGSHANRTTSYYLLQWEGMASQQYRARETQYLIISKSSTELPSAAVDYAHNILKDPQQINGEWKQITWVFPASPEQNLGIDGKPMMNWRNAKQGSPTPIQLHIWLPSKLAEDVFIKMCENPIELPSMLSALFPRMFDGEHAFVMGQSDRLVIVKEADPLEKDGQTIFKNAKVNSLNNNL